MSTPRQIRNARAMSRAQIAYDDMAEPDPERGETILDDDDGNPQRVVSGVNCGAVYVVGVIRDGCLCDTGYGYAQEECWRQVLQRRFDSEREEAWYASRD